MGNSKGIRVWERMAEKGDPKAVSCIINRMHDEMNAVGDGQSTSLDAIFWISRPWSSIMHFKRPVTKAFPTGKPLLSPSPIFSQTSNSLHTVVLAYISPFCNSPVILTIPLKPTADSRQDRAGLLRLAIPRCTMCITQLTELIGEIAEWTRSIVDVAG